MTPRPDETTAADGCRNCGKPIDGTDPRAADTGLCLECAVASAENRLELQDAAPAEVEPTTEQKRGLGKRAAIAAVSLVVAAVVVAWPSVFPAGGYEQPLRQGSAETDEVADECIENISVLFDLDASGDAFQNADDFECPATDYAYEIEWAEGKNPLLVTVACPDPGAHGLSSIEMEAGDAAPTVVE